MSSLYELDNTLLQLLEYGFTEQCVNLETGEIEAWRVHEYLETLPLEREKKIEGIALFIKNLEAEEKALADEIKNLTARKQAKERKAESMKSYLQQSLLLFNQLKYETAKVALSFRKSQQVIVEDIENLDEKYIKVKTERSPDKTAIKAAIKAGETVTGATLVENQNLQIK